jgi:YfiH family protein
MLSLYPDWDAPARVRALSTTRQGGLSQGPYDDGTCGGGLNLGLHVDDLVQHVAANRALLRTQIPAEPAWLSQVHGSAVADAAKLAAGMQADASIATQAGVVCAILTADCLPVLLCDSAGQVVGAAHAGWRGLAAGVLENTVESMRQAGARELLAWLGPAIGPERFEVGEEVLRAFVEVQPQAEAAFRPIFEKPGKYLADIYMLARLRLDAAGVRRVFGGGFCTVSDPRFYSYRRDRVTGRMASLIWIDEADAA